jgi:hypothetical protein
MHDCAAHLPHLGHLAKVTLAGSIPAQRPDALPSARGPTRAHFPWGMWAGATDVSVDPLSLACSYRCERGEVASQGGQPSGESVDVCVVGGSLEHELRPRRGGPLDWCWRWVECLPLVGFGAIGSDARRACQERTTSNEIAYSTPKARPVFPAHSRSMASASAPVCSR